MHQYVRLIFLLIISVTLLPLRQGFAAQTEPNSDVRLLIDVSGSMKKNDPNNLRSPALRLVVGLLSDDNQAGVWTFAKYVNMLVPHRRVNKDWRLKAIGQSYHIHSYGLYTDIEQALKKATADIKATDAHYQHNLILLSDGLVDISKNEQQSALSRQRIIHTLIPDLKKRHIIVHTIALSSTADHDLLKSLSIATGGWYEEADTASDLQRVFLHLFEKATHPDTVPLLDNHFKIDDSVTQMTLLIFRQPDSKPTTLIQPDRSRLTLDDKRENVRWMSENNYDLITIDQPQTGVWQIDANVDPDNRVMVVTDMKLKTTRLPNNILLGETFDLDASLTDKGKTITRQDFLKLVDARLTQESADTNPVNIDLNSRQHNGIYRTQIGKKFRLGQNDVVITMTSATFERQNRQSINVLDTPFDISIEQLKQTASRTHRILLSPNLDLIKADPLTITALLTSQDGSEWSYEFVKNPQKQWQLTISDLKPHEDYTLSLQIKAETVRGRSLFLQPDAITLVDETPSEQKQIKEENKIVPQNKTDAVPPKTSHEDHIQDSSAEQSLEKSEEVIDEMADELDSTLPEAEDISPVIEDSSTENDASLSPTMVLIIGNAIILAIILAGVLIWRRNSTISKQIGAQL